MTITFGNRLRPADEVLVSVVDGEAVLLHLGRECYFGLNDTGTAMWAALATADSIEAAVEQLERDFAVARDLLRRDVTAFVARLLEHELVQICNP